MIRKRSENRLYIGRWKSKLTEFILIALIVFSIGTDYAQAESVDFTIDISQSFKDSFNEDISEACEYILTAETEGAPLPVGHSNGIYEFTLTGQEARSLEFSFDKIGEYSYTVKPVTTSNGLRSIDNQAYSIKFHILDDASGNVDKNRSYAEIRYKGGVFDQDKTDGASWKHYLIVEDNNCVAANPPVQKKIIGGTPKEKSDFTFVLEAENSEFPMPEGSKNGKKTIIVTGEGTNEFGDIEYTEPGTYTYNVYEIKDEENKNYSYDQNVYRLTNIVELVNGELVLNQTVVLLGAEVSEQNPEIDAYVFVNEYKGEENPPTPDDKTPPGKTPPNGGKRVMTGDSSRPIVFGSIFIASALSIIVVFIINNKKKKKKNY